MASSTYNRIFGQGAYFLRATMEFSRTPGLPIALAALSMEARRAIGDYPGTEDCVCHHPNS